MVPACSRTVVWLRSSAATGMRPALSPRHAGVTRVGRSTMSGSVEELTGGLKEGVGKLVGNEKLEAKGRAQKTKGRLKRRAGALPKEVKGTAKEAAGKLTGNIDLEYEGKAQAEAGRLQSR